MQRINWEMSRDKWVPIVALLEKPGGVDWERLDELLSRGCGHCTEYGSCEHGCTLNAPNLCDFAILKKNESGFYILRRMCSDELPRNKRRALSIARRIYKAILKDEPKLTKL